MKKRQIAFIYLGIACGTLLLAAGLQFFLVPARLSSGGVSSVATVLYHLFGIPLSVTNLVANGLLFALGFRLLGRTALFRTAAGVLFLSLFLELGAFLPSCATGDVLIDASLGGLLVGAGIGLVIRLGGSTGGSDLAALMLHRFLPHISVPLMIMVIDCGIILTAALVFKSLSVAFYSILALIVSTKVSSFLCTVGDTAKSVFILSEKNPEIAQRILSGFSRGVTGLPCRGMYSEREGLMLLAAVSPKELPHLVKAIREIDRRAFIIVSDAREVLGEGFKEGEVYS